jgi:hypothetical protein
MPIYPNDPAFGGIQPTQLRRGTFAKVQNYVPASGELVFSTSTYQVFVGDGSTIGGHLVTGGGGGNLDFGTITVPAGFTLDLGVI